MARGGARKRAILKYDDNKYNPQGLQDLTRAELRAEYSRLRAIANKRVKRLADSEWTWTEAYKRNRYGFRKLKTITSDTELRYELTRVASFVNKQTTSASGLRRQRSRAIATLKDRGYKSINTKNFREFTEFMDYLRDTKIANIYDSDSAVDYIGSREVGDKTEKELVEGFEKFMEQQKPLNKIQNKNPRDDSQFRKALE